MIKLKKINAVTVTGGTYSTTIDIGGSIQKIAYIKDDFASGVDFTITDTDTTENIWTEADVNASKSVFPNITKTGVTGSALTGDKNIYQPVVCSRLTLAITSGGDAKNGAFYVYVEK